MSGDVLSRAESRGSSKGVSFGEVAERLRNFGPVQLTDHAGRCSPGVWRLCRGFWVFGVSCHVRESLGFERDHSGSKRNPLAFAWTPKVSTEKSRSLFQRPTRELPEACARTPNEIRTRIGSIIPFGAHSTCFEDLGRGDRNAQPSGIQQAQAVRSGPRAVGGRPPNPLLGARTLRLSDSAGRRTAGPLVGLAPTTTTSMTSGLPASSTPISRPSCRRTCHLKPRLPRRRGEPERPVPRALCPRRRPAEEGRRDRP